MTTSAKIAEVAGLVGDRARASMLTALMDGRAKTAGELAQVAAITAPTASGHLARLMDTGLLAMRIQGRHRYFRIASSEVARMLEGIMVVAADPMPPRGPLSPISLRLREARTCYDHLAGRLGVALSDALITEGAIELGQDAGSITEHGKEFFQQFGIPVEAARGSHRLYCRPCLDWSERRPHLAGILGAALLAKTIGLGWVVRASEGRAVSVTAKGRRGFAHRFHIDV